MALGLRYEQAMLGYYNYDQGYAPDFPGQDEFTGQIVHPQHWPEDLDYVGKDGGATALTLIPALADSDAPRKIDGASHSVWTYVKEQVNESI